MDLLIIIKQKLCCGDYYFMLKQLTRRSSYNKKHSLMNKYYILELVIKKG